MSLGFTINAGNALLDHLSPTLRGALYMAEPNQLTITGVDPGTPKLRTDAIRSAALAFAFEGWTLSVLRRVDARVGSILAACKVDKFRVEPLEGGSVKLSFRAGTSAIDADLIGDLCGQLGHEVLITLIAPEVKPAEPKPTDEDIAARKKLPRANRQATLVLVDEDNLTAAEIVAAQHGSAAKAAAKLGRPPKH